MLNEQPSHYFLNIIICCTCNMCHRAVEQAEQATTRKKPVFWVSDKASFKPISLAKQAS